MEGWSTGFEVVEYETEWRDNPFPGKVVTQTSGHKSSKSSSTLHGLAASNKCFNQQYIPFWVAEL